MLRRITVLVGALIAISCGSSAQSTAPRAPNNAEAHAACATGDADACALAGLSQWLHANAHKLDAKASQNSFEVACGLNDWFGCAMAGTLQSQAGADASATAEKAYGLAETACESDGDASACAFLGDWAARGKQDELARKHYGLACGLAMTAETREKVLGEFVCEQAIKFGADKASLVPSGPDISEEGEAKRTSGVTAIHPPQSEATAMVRRGVKQAGAEVILCLSETGVPRRLYFAQFSEFPKWNQKIFETMRTWHYSPAVDAKGAAVPVCTGVTFLYLPQR